MLEGKVAYIPVQQFNETTTREFAAELQRLQREGAKGLVIDLRRNTGGFLDQALELANFFLPRGAELATVREALTVERQRAEAWREQVRGVDRTQARRRVARTDAGRRD